MPEQDALVRSVVPFCVVLPWERCIVMAVFGRKGNCFRVTVLILILARILNVAYFLWMETIDKSFVAILWYFSRIHFLPTFSLSNFILTVFTCPFLKVKLCTSPGEPLYNPSGVSKFVDISTLVPILSFNVVNKSHVSLAFRVFNSSM